MVALARTLVVFLGLVAGLPALAAEVVLPPLVADGTVNAKQRALVNETLASELDLQPAFSGVNRLASRPSALTSTCLKRPKCLSRIASSNGSDTVVAGTLRRRGRLFWLDLVYFERERLVRDGTWSVPTDPTGLADALGPVVRELVTGTTVEDQAPAISDTDFDDLDEFEPDEPPIAPTPTPNDPGPDIQFGSADVRTAPLDEDDEQLDDVDLLTAGEGRVPPPIVERDKNADKELRRLQREREKAQAERERERERAAKAASRSPDDPNHSVQVIGRIGGSKYYAYNFLTGGAEVAVRMSDGLHFVAGLDVYGVNLPLTPEEQVELGRLRYWDAIFPIHLGLVYKFRPGEEVRPYAGLEVIFAQYFVDDVGGDWAGGPRLRGGVDWMIAENFGLNADVAFGFWVGQNWPFIDDRLRRAGLLPQVTVGPLVSF